MRLLVPAASAALIATVFLSATAAVPRAGAGAEPAVSAPEVSAPAGSARVGRTPLRGARTAAADSARVAAHGRFTWPLSPRPAVVRPFDRPQHQWSPGHRGVDLLAAAAQPVLSAGAGVVAFSGVVAGRGVVSVRHPGGLRTTYEPVDERLASGAVVQAGDRLGVVSPASGHCAPLTCLHWGAVTARADEQSYRDPLSLLGFGRPILLPLG
jgi:murein DD-endopeptidase MepM/ murein hydrolase activator NlpD